MAWISVHQEVDGTKLRTLYRAIGCSKFEALGILVFLWFWGLKNADEMGLVKAADLEVLARYLYGCGENSTVDMKAAAQALVDTGWIDMVEGGFIIHDWDTWQEQWYKLQKTKEYNAERKRRERSAEKNRKGEDDGGGVKAPEEPRQEPGPQAENCQEQPPEPSAGKGKSATKYADEFMEFWDAYPRKVDKGNAYKKYKARRNEGYSDFQLKMAAKNYADECARLRTEQTYIKHPKTFLSESLPFADYLPKEQERKDEESGNPFAEWSGTDG